jgi:very-short-patch-repair endonuclease
MAVQQGIVSVERLVVELVRIRRDKRRELLTDLLLDLAGGVRSIGELELAEECRARGLPEPSRQALRRSRAGRHYLDALWEAYGVAVEVDGIHHVAAPSVVADALRQNDLSLQGMTVLRLPLLGLRLAPAEFFAQVERALVAGGWSPMSVSA